MNNQMTLTPIQRRRRTRDERVRREWYVAVEKEGRNRTAVRLYLMEKYNIGGSTFYNIIKTACNE